MVLALEHTHIYIFIHVSNQSSPLACYCHALTLRPSAKSVKQQNQYSYRTAVVVADLPPPPWSTPLVSAKLSEIFFWSDRACHTLHSFSPTVKTFTTTHTRSHRVANPCVHVQNTPATDALNLSRYFLCTLVYAASVRFIPSQYLISNNFHLSMLLPLTSRPQKIL